SIWLTIEKSGTPVGYMTHKAWSYRLKSMIGFALVAVEAQPGDAVQVCQDGERINAQLTDLPFAVST
ncbi:MAG: glycine cleavage T C-terminal barrel domain-containing protein, partial [Pseudomonadota bacterium]